MTDPARAVAGGPTVDPDLPISLGEVVIVGGGCYGTFYARQLTQAKERGRAMFERLLLVDRDPACQLTRDLGQAPDRELVVSGWDDFFDRYLAEKAAILGLTDRLSACPPVRSPDRLTATEPPSGAAWREAGARESFRACPPVRQPVRPDVIVPSPLMPHLMYHWLLRRAHERWPDREIATLPLPEGPGTPYDRAVPDGTRYVSYADWLCPTHCIEPALCPVTRAPRTWEMHDAVTALTRRLARERPVAGPVLFRCEHLVFGVGTFAVADVLAGDAIVREAGAGGGAVDLPVGTVSSCHGAVNLLHLGPA
jgi:hypothetical protein